MEMATQGREGGGGVAVLCGGGAAVNAVDSSSTSSSNGVLEKESKQDSPILFFLFFHKAIRLELDALHRSALAYATGQLEDIKPLLKRYRFLRSVYKHHCHAEDEYVKQLDDLRSQLSATQATADASAASAQSAQLQCLALLKELNEKTSSLKEHEVRVNKLGEQLDLLQKDLQVRESSQRQLKDEVMRIEHDIMQALAKSGANTDCELRKVLDEVSPKNIGKMNKLLTSKDEELAKLRDEIRIMSAHWKLKTTELESQLEKHRRADQELKKRIMKLEFCLQEARTQTRKLQRMGERRDKAIQELRDQLATKQVGASSNNNQNFWDTSGFKVVVSMSMLMLVLFSKR